MSWAARHGVRGRPQGEEVGSNRERAFRFCLWSLGKDRPQGDQGAPRGQHTSLNCVRERSGPNTKLSGSVWRRQVERPGELWMWAAARCRAGLWGMPPLRSAPTISSSSSQRIYGRRAMQGVVRDTPHADWGITTLLSQKTPGETLPHRLGEASLNPRIKGVSYVTI